MGDETRQEFSRYLRQQHGPRPPLVDTPRARSSDRETSHLAARVIEKTGALRKDQIKARDAVRRFNGRTTSELAKLVSAETGEHWEALRHSFGRRLSELDGVVIVGGDPRKCSVTGRKATTWWIK